jgi:hypothetical protein
MHNKPSSKNPINWRQVGLFVGITVALSWLLNLTLWLRFGYASDQAMIFFSSRC